MRKFILLCLLCSTVATQAQFNGSQNGYMATQSGTLDNASVFTVEFWVKTTNNRSSNTYWQRPTLFGNETNGDNSGDLGIIINNGYIGMWEGISSLNTDQNMLSNSVRINDNFWHHIAAVCNGQTLNLYVDGNMVGSLVAGRPLRTFGAPLTFGAASLDHSFAGNYNNTNFNSQASFGEARISRVARYNSNFAPQNSFQSDRNDITQYHFGNQGNNNNYNNNNGNNNNGNNNFGNNNYNSPNIVMDPNRPVTFEPDQPLNNDYAQQATLFVNDSVVVYGKLFLGKKNWSFSSDIGIHFFENNSKKDKFIKPEDIKGFQMGDSYYEPKFLAQGGSVPTPSKKTMVRRLTPPNSKMAMYEYIATTNTKNPNGFVERKCTPVTLVQLPNTTDDKIYQFTDNKFTPHFDTRVSALVADKPQLADKIRSKDKSYFYAFITQDTHQVDVWWNIVNEYNKP